MTSNPKAGRKILEYCLENLGGGAFRCFGLTSQTLRKTGTKRAIPLEDNQDEEIDQGFDHVLRLPPDQLVRWRSSDGKPKNFDAGSPMFGWPPALVSQALRNISPDGALAR